MGFFVALVLGSGSGSGFVSSVTLCQWLWVVSGFGSVPVSVTQCQCYSGISIISCRRQQVCISKV